MKKILLILLSICILASCSSKKEAVDDETDSEVIEYHNNYDNLVPTTISEYDEEVEPNVSWSLEGKGEYSRDFTKKTLHIHNGEGNLEDSILISNPFVLNSGSYIVSFSVNSNIDKSINLVIKSDTKTYLNEYFDVYNGDNNYEYTFNGGLDYGAQVYFYLGDKSDESHTLEINNFNINPSNGFIGSRINQVGYLPNVEKQIVFNYTPGDYFYVVNEETNEVIYTGDISNMFLEDDSNEELNKGYFGDVSSEGTYYIRSEFGIFSNEFTISNSVYDELSDDVLYFLYLQRCGSDINDEKYGLAHLACHTKESIVFSYTEEEYLDTTGGWHDAGDYGKYLYDINQVIADLEFAYMYGDNKSDELLEEIKYGLDFILKLQRDSGSVYNKVTSKEFSKFVSPEYDNQDTYVLYRWTLTTSTFAGVMGLASEIFKDIDIEYSNTCLEAFKKAEDYLINNQTANNEHNPEGFNVGTYYKDDEYEERLFAYSVGYKLTKDNTYLDLINSVLSNDFSGENYNVYSYVSLLDGLDMSNKMYETIKDRFVGECNSLADKIKSNGYAYPFSSYSGGSNERTCQAINMLLLGARYLKDERYLKRGEEAIGYILGMNALNMSFVYGYGFNYPHTMHNRLVMSKGYSYVKGALASGVNENLTEGMVGQYFNEDSSKGLRFVDNPSSYSNVEPSINYNSALVLSLSLLDYANNNKLQ